MVRGLLFQIGIGFILLGCFFIAWPFLSIFVGLPEKIGHVEVSRLARYGGAIALLLPGLTLMHIGTARQ